MTKRSPPVYTPAPGHVEIAVQKAESNNRFPEIPTERLVIRCLAASDAEEMYAYRSHPGVLRFQTLAPKSVDEVQLFITENAKREFNITGWYQVAIGLREAGGKIIGDCGIHVFDDNRVVELGITLSPEFHGSGYATEALRGLINYHFVNLGKHRVITQVDPSNEKSMALMERVGMRKEGYFVQSYWFKENWVDNVIFAVLSREWTQVNRQQSGDDLISS